MRQEETRNIYIFSFIKLKDQVDLSPSQASIKSLTHPVDGVNITWNNLYHQHLLHRSRRHQQFHLWKEKKQTIERICKMIRMTMKVISKLFPFHLFMLLVLIHLVHSYPKIVKIGEYNSISICVCFFFSYFLRGMVTLICWWWNISHCLPLASLLLSIE